MELIEISRPARPQNGEILFGTPIPPIDKLRIISSDEFEAIVLEWAYDYLRLKYHTVFQLGGAGDKGRDIVAHLDDSRKKIDIYQCKHYDSPLAPSEYWVEFGKLCYYTFIGDYPIPQKYNIVASQGIGPKLKDYINNPHTIAEDLIQNWDKYCKTGISKKSHINLTVELETYIRNFDFSIVQEIPPIQLIDEYSKTKWYKYRFGGGLKKRPKRAEVSEIHEDETKLPYITQLLKAYSEYANINYETIESVSADQMLSDHLHRQRVDYHTAQALKRFSRDEFIDEDPYEEAKEEIYYGVVDIARKKYPNGLERANTTLSEARKISLDGNELGKLYPSDKSGMCHDLVNEEKIRWVD